MKRVVLVRPRGPRNVGLACRAAANFGPVDLVLVAPETADILQHRDFEEMAHGVADAAGQVAVVATLSDALADCTHAVGFTGRTRQHREISAFDDVAEALRGRGDASAERLALVFGSENDGLSNDDIERMAELVRIPTAPAQPSINLGTSVAVVLHRLYGSDGALPHSRKNRPLSGEERERLKRRLRDELGVRIRGRSGRDALHRSIDRVFGRAELESRDAQAWYKLLRELGRHEPS